MIGDPRWVPHPVQFIGYLIKVIRKWIEYIAGDNKFLLSIGGLILAFSLIFISAASGWMIERLITPGLLSSQIIGPIIVIISLASSLASRSLRDSVLEVVRLIPKEEVNIKLNPSRAKLSHIVGRDVDHLTKSQILRAAAETASENAVDGIFGPLLWMLIGTGLWEISFALPGPLALAWAYKASSTIDSMIGYRQGRLLWLGKTGARLEDLLTWLPSRLVLITLPLTCKPLKQIPQVIQSAWLDGSKYDSPNAGLSEAIFAYCTDIKLGGESRYNGILIYKPIICKELAEPSKESIYRILNLSLKLQFYWLFTAITILWLL